MKILIVDDDSEVVAFFSQVADIKGYTDIDVAFSAEDALTQVIRETYDLITLDILMPGASGLEILTLLRNLCPHAVIAIISGHIPEEISPEATGCTDVILDKPVDMETFHRLLESASRVSEAMEQVRLLGNVSVSVQ